MKTSGKVDRKALPWPLVDVGGADTDLPTPSQKWLKDLWIDQLGPVGIDLDTNFFTAGGGSVPGRPPRRSDPAQPPERRDRRSLLRPSDARVDVRLHRQPALDDVDPGHAGSAAAGYAHCPGAVRRFHICPQRSALCCGHRGRCVGAVLLLRRRLGSRGSVRACVHRVGRSLFRSRQGRTGRVRLPCPDRRRPPGHPSPRRVDTCAAVGRRALLHLPQPRHHQRHPAVSPRLPDVGQRGRSGHLPRLRSADKRPRGHRGSRDGRTRCRSARVLDRRR